MTSSPPSSPPSPPSNAQQLSHLIISSDNTEFQIPELAALLSSKIVAHRNLGRVQSEVPIEASILSKIVVYMIRHSGADNPSAAELEEWDSVFLMETNRTLLHMSEAADWLDIPALKGLIRQKMTPPPSSPSFCATINLPPSPPPSPLQELSHVVISEDKKTFQIPEVAALLSSKIVKRRALGELQSKVPIEASILEKIINYMIRHSGADNPSATELQEYDSAFLMETNRTLLHMSDAADWLNIPALKRLIRQHMTPPALQSLLPGQLIDTGRLWARELLSECLIRYGNHTNEDVEGCVTRLEVYLDTIHNGRNGYGDKIMELVNYFHAHPNSNLATLLIENKLTKEEIAGDNIGNLMDRVKCDHCGQVEAVRIGFQDPCGSRPRYRFHCRICNYEWSSSPRG